MPMPEIPPTPGPSAVGNDHPWAKLFAQQGGGQGQEPATPGGGRTPGGLLGGGNLSLPVTRRPPTSSQNPTGKVPLSKFNGALSGTLRDPRPSSAHSPSAPDSKQATQQASHFASVPLTASHSLPIPHKHTGAGVSEDQRRFQGIECQTLAGYLGDVQAMGKHGIAETSILILDIRPSTSFVNGRVKSSINVCAPSTLLKRPGVTVERVQTDMLQSEDDRELFARWQGHAVGGKKAIERIVVLDTDTASVGDPGRPSVGGGGACLVGLLKKFDTAGFAGELLWLVGGYTRFEQHVKETLSHLLEAGPKAHGQDSSNQSQHTASSGSRPPSLAFGGQLKLPGGATAATSSTSSSAASQNGSAKLPTGSPSLVQRGLPTEAFTNKTTTDTEPKDQAARNGRSGGVGFGAQLGGHDSFGSSKACNPFFDNIRQNRELQHGITERIPLEIGELTVAEKEVLPPFLRRLVDADKSTRAEGLAQGFFDVEKAEQHRLMATMHQHTNDSGIDPRGAALQQPDQSRSRNAIPGSDAQSSPQSLELASPLRGPNSAMQLSSPYCHISSKPSSSLSSSSFPFSIAAAIERGAENRYNNIWTYEHSRVKVATDDIPATNREGSTCSEYFNGSFVEPLREFGCHRQYIATQAPLPSTFETFWRAVWQHNSRTIAMLTRQYESGRVQSHDYWSETSYGTTIKLRLLEEKELNARGEPCGKAGAPMTNSSGTDQGGFFAEVSRDAAEDTSKDAVMVVRKLELTYAGSQEGPRIIHHLQYIAWPDYSIPSDPQALLVFMDIASRCQQGAHLALSGGKTPLTSGSRWARESATGPLMLHCSAGVGRTGTYAVIDSVLDVLRRERARRKGILPLSVWDNGTGFIDNIEGAGDTTVTADGDVEMSSSGPSGAPQAAVPQTPDRVTKIRAAQQNGLQPWPASHQQAGSATSLDPFSFGSAANTSVQGAPLAADAGFARNIRRSLKRELSPSAHMAVDESGTDGATDPADGSRSSSSFASPPPMRRNRSSSSDVALSTTSSSDTGDSDLASWTSDAEGPASDKREIRDRTRSSASSTRSSGWMGIRQPDGMDTPSRAMDGMNLGFNTTSGHLGMSGSPINSAATSARQSPCPPPSSTPAAATQPYSAVGGRRGSLAKQPRSSTFIASPQQQAAASSGASGAGASASSMGRSASHSPPYATSAFGDVDLVRTATDVAREQRMSSVQTQRQYVFCYSAVLKGVLRENERDA